MATKMENPMARSGFCQWPSEGSHGHCRSSELRCACGCHQDPESFPDPVFESNEEGTDQ